MCTAAGKAGCDRSPSNSHLSLLTRRNDTEYTRDFVWRQKPPVHPHGTRHKYFRCNHGTIWCLTRFIKQKNKQTLTTVVGCRSWSSQHRGLRLQDGRGSGVAVELHHVLGAVPGGEAAAEVATSAQAAVQTHAAPLPLQLALNLHEQVTNEIWQIQLWLCDTSSAARQFKVLDFKWHRGKL